MNDVYGKYNKRGFQGDFERAHVYYYGEVVSTNDPDGAGRIKVEIMNLDKDYRNSDGTVAPDALPWAYPLLPKFFNVVPKIGEAVRIIMWTSDNGSNQSSAGLNRAYIGPLIGQPQYLHLQKKREAMGLSSSIGNEPESYNPYKKGDGREGHLIFPKPEYISVQGRQNADIILTKQEINIRAGSFLPNMNIGRDQKNLQLNKKNPPRIQIKMVNENNSATNIYSNKIHLITYDSSIGSPDVVGKGGRGLSYNKLSSNGFNDGLLKDLPSGSIDTYLTQESEPLIYGDKLVYFLELIKQYVKGHEHKGAEEGPITGVGKIDEILKFNLEQLKNQNIRIN